MNKEIECNIIKDLAVPFINKAVTDETENFIKSHLKTCNNCQNYYKNISNKKKILEKDGDSIMINKFKKIHKHINILRTSLILIVLLISIISATLFIKNQKVVNIINTSCNKIEYLKGLDNYKLSIKTTQKDFKNNFNWEYEQNYYYKDGKFKIEDNNSIKFYEDNSYENVCVYDEFQTIEYNKLDFVDWKKGDIVNIFSNDLLNYKKMTNTIYSLGLNVREDSFNGIDCYIIRDGNDNNYRDIWINKDNFIVIRIINEDYNNFCREEIYEFTENIVTNDDVSREILNSEKYKNYIKEDIIINGSKDIKLYN